MKTRLAATIVALALALAAGPVLAHDRHWHRSDPTVTFGLFLGFPIYEPPPVIYYRPYPYYVVPSGHYRHHWRGKPRWSARHHWRDRHRWRGRDRGWDRGDDRD